MIMRDGNGVKKNESGSRNILNLFGTIYRIYSLERIAKHISLHTYGKNSIINRKA